MLTMRTSSETYSVSSYISPSKFFRSIVPMRSTLFFLAKTYEIYFATKQTRNLYDHVYWISVVGVQMVRNFQFSKSWWWDWEEEKHIIIPQQGEEQKLVSNSVFSLFSPLPIQQTLCKAVIMIRNLSAMTAKVKTWAFWRSMVAIEPCLVYLREITALRCWQTWYDSWKAYPITPKSTSRNQTALH